MAYKICEKCQNYYMSIYDPDDICWKCRNLETGKAKQEKARSSDSSSSSLAITQTFFCANCQMIDDVGTHGIHCCYEGMQYQDRIKLAEIEIGEMRK